MYTEYSEKDNIGKVSQYENKWYPSFLKQTPYFTNSFLFIGKIWTIHSIWLIFKKSVPSL